MTTLPTTVILGSLLRAALAGRDNLRVPHRVRRSLATRTEGVASYFFLDKWTKGSYKSDTMVGIGQTRRGNCPTVQVDVFGSLSLTDATIGGILKF